MTRATSTGRRTSRSRELRLAVAVALNLLIVVAQVVAGFAASSVGLLADAGHNLTDVAAVTLSLVALRWTRRAPTTARSYGYHRSGVLAAQVNALALLAVSGVLAVESARRVGDAQAVDGLVVVVVALVAAAVNGLSAWVVHEPGGGDLNTRSALLHLISDALVSVGVAATGAVILLTDGLYWLDPLASLLISLLIAAYAVRLLRQTADVLLESTPADLDLDLLTAEVLAVPGVLGLHDVHVWSLSDELRAASGHVLVAGHPSLEAAHQVGLSVKEVLRDRFAIGHATLELECESCAPLPADACRLPGPDLVVALPGHHHGSHDRQQDGAPGGN